MDTEFTMAADATYNSILNEIQLSRLNFSIQLTPYAAYITLKKSIQVNCDGIPAVPSPPLFMLYQQSNRDLMAAKKDIIELKAALHESGKKCDDLMSANASILLKLKTADENLALANGANAELTMKLNSKKQEVIKLTSAKNSCEMQVNRQEKDHLEYVRETEDQVKSLNKIIKVKEKETYNLNKTLGNLRDTVASLKEDICAAKSRESKLKAETRKALKKLKRFEVTVKQRFNTSSQTLSTIDTPYTVVEPLPPIFGSQLCVKTKAPFLSKSLPDISTLVFVNITEEDKIRDAAEDALSLQYDRSIAEFYDDARMKAANLRQIFDENVIGQLFEPE